MTPLGSCILLGGFFLADMLATYFYIRKVRQRYPKMDIRWFEYNPFVQWAWGRFGLDLGTMIAPIIISPFWFVAIFVTIAIPVFIYAFVGMYMLLFSMHITNLAMMYSKEDTPLSELYERAYGSGR